MDIGGTCDRRFDAVRAAFEANFDLDRPFADTGASVAVTVEGELVVDLWGGTIDTDAAGRGDGTALPWERDTIVNVWSNSKTVCALALLMLADQGELDLHAPVAKVWPEFGVNGKRGVLVRHVMAHTAGLPTWDPPVKPEVLFDWDKACAVLATQTPWWEPGTASGYHAFTQGFIEGELVRRITGQTMGEFVRAEIAGPLGADFHIGLDPVHDSRVGHVIAPRTSTSPHTDPESIGARTERGLALDPAIANEVEWRRAEVPAGNGHGNARSLALIHAPMACGGRANGVTLLSSSGADAVFDEQFDGVDLVLGTPVRFGIGFGLPGVGMPLPNANACYWGGWGGSSTIVDIDARVTMSYVMTRMGDDVEGEERATSLRVATYACLDAL